jgi:hypothetical protein
MIYLYLDRHVLSTCRGTMPSLGTWLSGEGKNLTDTCAICRQVFTFAAHGYLSVKFLPFPFSSRTRRFDTYPPGTFGRNGSHGEFAWSEAAESEVLRAHWIIGPPFEDLKSLATMSNAKGVGGWQTLLTNFICKPSIQFLSPITPRTPFPKISLGGILCADR